MVLIIFDKHQQISFQRFVLSVFTGAAVLLLLGALHSWLHGMPLAFELGAQLDGRILLLAAAVGIILGVIYFDTIGPAAWSERTIVESRKDAVLAPTGYWRAAEVRRLFAYVIGGDILLFGFGLHGLVWKPIVFGTDTVYALGGLALACIAIFVPLHYAALLKLDACTAGMLPEVCAFAQHRFGQILYWVLVVFWAALFASYLILLTYSHPYCHYFVC
jgi:hypothetical protein